MVELAGVLLSAQVERLRGLSYAGFSVVDILVNLRHLQMWVTFIQSPQAGLGPAVALPAGWEERQDANGRTYYVNHIGRCTPLDS